MFHHHILISHIMKVLIIVSIFYVLPLILPFLLAHSATSFNWLIWTEGPDNLKIFIDYLNNIHQIKFTSSHSQSSTNVPFLDVSVPLTKISAKISAEEVNCQLAGKWFLLWRLLWILQQLKLYVASARIFFNVLVIWSHAVSHFLNNIISISLISKQLRVSCFVKVVGSCIL